MGLKDLFRKYFVIEDDDDGYEEVDEPSAVVPVRRSERNEEGAPSLRSTQKRSTKAKVIPMNQQAMTEKASIHVVEPRVYSEVEKIADNLLKNQAVLLNFKRIDAEQAKRIVDFLTGTVYAIGGEIQRVGDEIFLCTPASVGVEGALAETLEEERSFY